MSYFLMYDDTCLTDLGNGVSRSVLANSEQIMMVKVNFPQYAIGETHSHPHEQTTYILEGTFEFTFENETKIVKKGDSIYFSPNVNHGAVFLDTGSVLDIFTPYRKDFLQ